MAEPTSPQEEFNLHREQAERNGIEPMSYREFVDWFLKGYRRQEKWFKDRIQMFEEDLANSRASLDRIQKMIKQYEVEAKKLGLEESARG